MDTVRAAGRHLRAQMVAAPEDRGMKEAAMRDWDDIFEALQQPAAFGRRRYKALVQQHAEVIISSLRRRDTGARCNTAERPVPACPGLAQTDAAEHPAASAAAAAAAGCGVAHDALASKKSVGKGGSKAQAVPQPAAGGDAAAAQARAQAAMDELILEEVGCPAPTPRLWVDLVGNLSFQA